MIFILMDQHRTAAACLLGAAVIFIAAACTSGADDGPMRDAAGEECGPMSCPGCCFNGVCQEGTHPSACGFGGATCRPCSPGQVCDNGSCAGEGCTVESCPAGCCSGDRCERGDAGDACGRNGYECEECGEGHHCESGECAADVCSASTCPDGCCEGSQCYTEHSDAHCGSRGAGCLTCGGDEHCLGSGGAFTCSGSGSDTYIVKLVSAVVDGTKSDAERHEWDGMYETSCVDTLGCGIAGCCPPDVYVEEGSSIAGLPIPKIVEANTTTPAWDLVLGNASMDQLDGGSVNVTLMDEDESLLADDPIGMCSGTVSASQVTSGQLMLTRTTGCTGSVQSINFSFTSL